MKNQNEKPDADTELGSTALFADYVEGIDCICAAYDECECGCGADWTPKIEKLVEAWRDMPADQMRLRCGEMTAQEIRTVRAVLNQILTANVQGDSR